MYDDISCALLVQAEEAAHKEARRLAEEEELREHRRKLQFKVHMLSTMHLLSRTPATPHPVSRHPVPGFHLSKDLSYTTCAVLCVVVCLCMMTAGVCNTAGCTVLECMCSFAGKASANIWGTLLAFPVRLQADGGQEPCLLHSLKRPLSRGALGNIARGVHDG